MKRPAVTTSAGTSASRDRRMVFASSSYQRVLWCILESEILFHAPLPHYPQVDQSSNAFCIIGTFHDFSIEMQFINQKIEHVDKIHRFTNGSMQQLNFLIQNMSVSKSPCKIVPVKLRHEKRGRTTHAHLNSLCFQHFWALGNFCNQPVSAQGNQTYMNG